MLAQLTTTRAGTCVSRASLRAVVVKSESETSHAMPVPPMIEAVLRAASPSKSSIATFAPTRPRRVAVSSPNPEAPLVTIAAWSRGNSSEHRVVLLQPFGHGAAVRIDDLFKPAQGPHAR